MKDGNDVFKSFRNSFDKINGHFHILEQRVPVERQMEYFKYSAKVRKELELPEVSNMDFSVFQEDLDNPDSSVEQKKYLLSVLATSHKVEAYRILEEYAQAPDPAIADWAYMALMESRISLESDFSDEKQIYISTGLGGKGERLRFEVLILANELKPFKDYQCEVIKQEFPYLLEKVDCEVERLVVGEKYVELLFLISVRADIKYTLDRIIEECNEYGNFLSTTFTITNVKEFSQEEIEELIRKNERNS